MSDLASRAVACPRWRWMPGMVVIERDDTMRGRVSKVRRNRDRLDVFTVTGSLEARDDAWHVEDATPDLSDPATIGCLVALVREAHASLQSTEYVGDGDSMNPWRWGSFKGRSEVEALVNALEGAP